MAGIPSGVWYDVPEPVDPKPGAPAVGDEHIVAAWTESGWTGVDDEAWRNDAILDA